MSTLEDRRPVAATTTASNNPSVIGEDLAQLLLEHPDLELASIRLIPNDDGTVGIIGRRGPLTTDGCPSCHTTAGHPHTDYCQMPNPSGDVDEHCHECGGAGCAACASPDCSLEGCAETRPHYHRGDDELVWNP